MKISSLKSFLVVIRAVLVRGLESVVMLAAVRVARPHWSARRQSDLVTVAVLRERMLGSDGNRFQHPGFFSHQVNDAGSDGICHFNLLKNGNFTAVAIDLPGMAGDCGDFVF